MIATTIYLQFSIMYFYDIRNHRMIIQAAFVALQSALLYVIIIGTSEIQFEETPLNKIFMMTIFNDNSE